MHLSRFACTALLTLVVSFQTAVSPLALEATASRAGDQMQTDLNTDMKVSAFSAAVQAAFNALKDRVDAFDGRITALETWKPTIDAAITDLRTRIAALEARAPSWEWMLNSWRPWAEAYLASLNSRVAVVEARPAGASNVSYRSCGTYAANPGSGFTCPAGYFVKGAWVQGTLGGCSSAGCAIVRQTCCEIYVY